MASSDLPRSIAAMKSAPMFSALDDAALRALLEACVTRRHAAGWMIFGPSERAERFFVILSGRVKVFKLSAKGDEQILHLYGPGATFGEAAMWARGRYPAFAQAVSDCELLVVRRDTLRRAIERNGDLAMGMLVGLSSKLHEFAALIEQLSLREVPARLAAALLAEADRAGARTFRLRQTKRQLAAQIGTVAETLSRGLAKLRDAGLIAVKGAQITVLDADGLRALAAEG